MKPSPPQLRLITNLWTLTWYPSQKKEWSLERKLAAVKTAGFDGFSETLTPAHQKLAQKFGLLTLGFFPTHNPREFRDLLHAQRDLGARHINVHLGLHDTPVEVAAGWAVKLMEEGRALGVEPSIEVHRATCTETPEKTFALADAYEKITGELLPFTWDHSHPAVVKHIFPPFWNRLGVRLDLLQRAQQFHFRPFNGHHCQVPVTDGRGEWTPETRDYLPFMEKVMATWLAAAAPGREMFVTPELGPLWLGYNLHALPNSWDDSQILGIEIRRRWQKLLKSSVTKK